MTKVVAKCDIDFGAAVRESRRLRKLSQSDVAAEGGLSRQAIVLLEAGGGRVSTLLAVQKIVPIRLRGVPPGHTFGQRLRAARNGRSVAEVARQANLSPNTVKALEADGGTVSALVRLLRVVAPTATVIALAERRRSFPTVVGRPTVHRSIQDHYSTPAPIVRLLLDHEHFEGSILEPCVGEARVVEHVLQERGYADVTCFDIAGHGNERRDFFEIEERYDVVLTNPPYNQHAAFIAHAKRIARKKIALLMPLNYLTGKQRQTDIWDDETFPLSKVLVLNRGVNFLAEDPFADRVQPSQLYCAWFIFEFGHQGPPAIAWLDTHSVIARR